MLSASLGQLRTQDGLAGGPDWARDLLAEARSHCDATVDLTLLCEAADALGRALESANDADRDALRAICHDFIDLARRRTVRLAGFGNDAGRQWIQRVVGLIERSDLTVGHMLRQRRTQYADKPLFLVPQGERCTTYTFQQVADVTDQLAKGIYSLLGERPRVAMCTANRLEGALLDLACLANGIFVTPIPPHTVSAQLGLILKESAAQMLFVSGPGQVQNAIDVLGELPDLRWLVVLGDGPPSVGGAANTLSYAQLLEKGASAGAEGLMSGRRGVRSSDLATTMYTSGTTGAPKGIQFTQLNLVSKRFCRAAALPEMDHQEVFLCYLPLYHTFGRFLEMLGCVHLGATYVFAENPSTDTLLAQMKRFQPTALISVPKKWRDIHQCVGAQVPDEDDPQRVRAVLEETTGGKLRWGLSAAGRLDPDVFRFFQRHGLDLMSGYGMTEATGGITMTPPGGYVPDSIGPPLPGIDIKLGPDGELMLRGPYVSPGYTDARDNLAAFSDGWLHTGDIVRCDRQGYYWHVDRKKDIYKNSGGRTVAPQRVERLFADFPEISRVFAVGDGREFVTLLIRPNTDYAEVNFANMSEATMREYFRGLVASCNRFLAPFERVIDFALIDRDFSEQHGELTSKSSFRRSVVEQHFAPQIERMYASTTLERSVDGLRVLVPVAFLQHLGATESGVKVTSEGLLFQAIERTLPMRRDRRARHLVWVGNCCYALPAETVDLNQWLRLPELWVGNAELTDVSGESILLWSVSEGRRGGVNMIEAAPAGVDTSQWRERCGQRRAAREVDLLTVHAACSVLLEPSPAVALSAVDYLAHVLAEGQERLASLAEARLQLAADHPDEAVRSRAFAALYEYQTQGRFGVTASRFCRTWRPVLDDQACQVIARLGPRCESWEDFARVLDNLRPAPGRQVEPQVGKFVLGVLVKLVRVADLTRDFYLPVRRELIAWMTACGPGELRDGAQRLLNELIRSFRDWLGQSKRSAVDPATGRQYTWGETLHFEEGIDPVELGRIANAIQHTELVREAVYLLHFRRKIDLDDLPPGSIWVSLLGTRYGRSLYRLAVRFGGGERCDFALYVRGQAPAERFVNGLHLTCIAAEQPGEVLLTRRLGGYWPEYGLASAEFVRGEAVGNLLEHMHDHPDREVRQRIKDAWPHVCWSALTAAFEFYRRTGGRWMLTGALDRDVNVALNDFDTDTRVLSVAGWRSFGSPLSMLLRFQHEFLDRICFQYPALQSAISEGILFDAALESLGQQRGVAFLEGVVAEARAMRSPSQATTDLVQSVERYLQRVEGEAFMPKAVRFAIGRYRTWVEQVPDATLHARAAQLRELQSSYRIEATVRRFPGARLQLYAETVLADLPGDARQTVQQAIRQLRQGRAFREVLGRMYSDLQPVLDSEARRYFLTRAAYPHLDVEEKAELVASSEEGAVGLELVTEHIDRGDRPVRMRPVANSREVDALHRIFFVGGLGEGLTGQDDLLVLLDEVDTVVGGVGYHYRTPTHVSLDRIAVLPRFRGMGRGKILMTEFIRRLQAEGVTLINAQFIRKDWLEQFDFKSDPRYAGVVRYLQPTA